MTDRLALLGGAAREYGDAVRIPVGPRALYLFNHPDYAKHILADNHENYRKGIGLTHARRALGNGLLTSEGELWRQQRRTVQPLFQARRVAGQTTAIAEEAVALAHRLGARRAGDSVDVLAEVTGLTLGVLGRTLLDADLRAHAHVGSAFEAVQDQAMFELVTLNLLPNWLPTPGQVRFRRARRYLQGVVDQLVNDRLTRGPSDEPDLVGQLIQATAGDPDPGSASRRRRDELVTLLLAGHETTASTLGWTLYLLDRHPAWWERLHREAVAVLGDRVPEQADLRQLTSTTAVVEEAMRLFPPVWLLPRQARGPDEVGGYRVPAGAHVLVCPYTLHRHPDFWSDPERFDPERFEVGRLRERPRYAYLPFGAGPRVCIGSTLGLAEAVLTTAVLCRELRLRTVPGYRVQPEPMLSLRLRGGLPMTVERLG